MKAQTFKWSSQLTMMTVAGMLTFACTERYDAGPLITENRDVPPYSRIEIRGSFHVEVHKDNQVDVQITAPNNLMPYIETYVLGNTLIIDERKNKIKDWGNTRIELSENMLQYIDFSGSGSLNGDTIYHPAIDMNLSGSGKIELPISTQALNVQLRGSGIIRTSGEAEVISVDLSGSGNVFARNVYAGSASVNVSGSGNVEVFSENSLVARVTGSGNIRYWGNPESINSQVTGSGRVIRM